MPNHYHLMLESVTGDLGGSYSQRVNRLHRWNGPLFRGRYHNRLVGTEAYWRHLLVYLHLNPEQAGFAEALRWTSHGAYLGMAPPPPWLETSTPNPKFVPGSGTDAVWGTEKDPAVVPKACE